jgi:putative iron-dependent peroxidase
MEETQRGILVEIPAHARYVFYELVPGVDAKEALAELSDIDVGADLVIGLGPSLVWAAGSAVAGLHAHPPMIGPGVAIPSTPYALLAWHRGEDRGDIVLAARELEDDLGDFFEVAMVVDGFRYGEGRDLTGYLIGTKNPKGDDAIAAALVSGAVPGMKGSSFVAVSKWDYDLDAFYDAPETERDLIVGRRLDDDTEIDDAPESAHMKRTAQESFEPEAFVLRRSMSWADEDGEGQVFVAFGKSFDAYEGLLRRMVGLEDGLVDALFTFTRPVTGSYFWCPPIADGALDLRALDADPA